MTDLPIAPLPEANHIAIFRHNSLLNKAQAVIKTNLIDIPP